jgi:predicted nucleic acid-binding Zn ribbon protein
MSGPRKRGPKPLSEVLNALVSARGFGRLRGQAELEAAWEAAVGEPACRHTRPGAVRRGVLSVVVAHPALLEELSAFRKPDILAALRQTPAGAAIHDIRFRIGPID